ncbi:MAG: hypothetical protein HY707_15010 [Ignavibacteriae bacterium]|nr:hypothetical protein [Ignavibacteriota bacterium]
MTAQGILRIVSYTTASLILVLGIIILFGFFLPSYVPSDFRIMLGIVMVLYGIYRVSILWIKQRSERHYDE